MNPMPKRIFLTGFMGCGKTHSARHLAEAMGIPFIDLDDYIEEKQGKTIAAIFAEEGEEAFRNIEANALRTAGQAEQFIMATGGGSPCFHQNMDWMNQRGKTIYLKAPAWLLQGRLVHQTSKRPLLAQRSPEELLQFIETKLLERESYYAKAQLIFYLQKVEQKNLEDLIGELKKIVGVQP